MRDLFKSRYSQKKHLIKLLIESVLINELIHQLNWIELEIQIFEPSGNLNGIYRIFLGHEWNRNWIATLNISITHLFLLEWLRFWLYSSKFGYGLDISLGLSKITKFPFFSRLFITDSRNYEGGSIFFLIIWCT